MNEPTLKIAKLSDFVPQRENMNRHTPRGMALLETAMQHVGYVAPMTAAADGEVIDGSARLEKSAEVFSPDAEAIVVEHDGTRPVIMRRLDVANAQTDRAKEISAGANRIAQVNLDFDPAIVQQLRFEVPALGALWTDEEMQTQFGDLTNGTPEVADVEPQIDKAEELRAQWGVESGQLWQLGEHRLLCGDSTKREDVEWVMGGEKADCVFTSPPYAVGVDYGETYEDSIENLRVMLPKLASLWLETVCEGGFAVVNFGDVASGRNIAESEEPCEYPMGVEYWPVFRAAGWLLWSRRVWCKPTPRVNSLWCIQSNRAASDWEHLWTWRKPGEPIIKRVDGEFSSVNGWVDTSHLHGVDEGKEIHGAGMAVGIAEWMVTVHSRPGAIVHEPFCGTGTTIIACEQLGRQGRAIEISPAYVAVALQRWADATGKQPVLQVI